MSLGPVGWLCGLCFVDFASRFPAFGVGGF